MEDMEEDIPDSSDSTSDSTSDYGTGMEDSSNNTQYDFKAMELGESSREGPVKIYIVTANGNKVCCGTLHNVVHYDGYTSFAKLVREESNRFCVEDSLVHVLWPWHDFRTRYIGWDHYGYDYEIDPRRLPWCVFKYQIKEILFEESIRTNGYSLVDKDENTEIGSNKLRIIFRSSGSRDIVRDIDRSFVNGFRYFLWVLHIFCSSWFDMEPLEQEYLTDKTIIVELFTSVTYYDEYDMILDIPNYLSINTEKVGDGDGDGDGDEDGESNKREIINPDEIDYMPDVQDFLNNVRKAVFVKGY